MAIDNNSTNFVSKNVIKGWFKTGLKPLQNQFWAWMDSYWHKDEEIPLSKIENFSSIIDGKASINHTHAQYATNNAESLSIQDIEKWKDKLGVNDIVVEPSREVLEQDFITDLALGSIDAGTTLPLGLSALDILKTAMADVFDPTVQSYTWSGSSPNVEVGTPTKIITFTWNGGKILGQKVGGVWNPNAQQGNAYGPAISYEINGEAATSSPKTISRVTTVGTNTIQIKVNYAAGDVPLKSDGTVLQPAKSAGQATANVSWQGFQYRWAGVITEAPTSATVRAMTTKRNDAGELILTIPVGNDRFGIFIPFDKSLTSVTDTTVMPITITDLYELKNDNFLIKDAGGVNTMRYKYYEMKQDNSTPQELTHKIITT